MILVRFKRGSLLVERDEDIDTFRRVMGRWIDRWEVDPRPIPYDQEFPPPPRAGDKDGES